ncbi:MAG: KEOPS complex N(6)-L-threonylcarbamoyladenine synthase Kae1, partial [Candidatus Altarchaeum sp.]|nr:KEOPS complex N(6)-L-threonylcarbamoyladenine synthase Kae1 [Candidatus Altarchaeum sp.]
MNVLGIEGTAHTFGVGIINDSEGELKILADVRKVYSPAEGGINPYFAAEFMAENADIAIKEALKISGLDTKKIDLLAFSQGPGLGPTLRTAATSARTLSLYHNIPLLGVNHCIAHIEIGIERGHMKNPLIVYVSGGNTQILIRRENFYRIFGETMDIGLGNMVDKFGREFGLKHPAGPKVEELAKNGKNFIDLPYTVKGANLCLSGLLTSAIKKKDGVRFNKTFIFEDLCYSLQETAFSMLVEVSERALAHLNAKELLLTGGVGNNKRLQEMLNLMAKEHNVRFFVPNNYCSDNGIMIALTGLKMFKAEIRQNFEETK